MGLRKAERCVCAYCVERFANTSSWLAHRVGDEYHVARRCLEPAQMEALGMHKAFAVYWLLPYKRPKALGLLRGVGPKRTRKVPV